MSHPGLILLRQSITVFSCLKERNKVLGSGFASVLLPRALLARGKELCFFSTQTASQLSTSDGVTVDGIVASNWAILDETENDWKSHATAIARLNLLSMELNKPDLWADPVHAGKISREHGSLMVKMKEVKGFEQELLEHIDMIKMSREENDTELESVGSHFLS